MTTDCGTEVWKSESLTTCHPTSGGNEFSICCEKGVVDVIIVEDKLIQEDLLPFLKRLFVSDYGADRNRANFLRPMRR